MRGVEPCAAMVVRDAEGENWPFLGRTQRKHLACVVGLVGHEQAARDWKMKPWLCKQRAHGEHFWEY